MDFNLKGMFISESAVKMSNRHIKVPKIAPALLFPVSIMIIIEKILIFSFFCIYQIIYLKYIHLCNYLVMNFLYALKSFETLKLNIYFSNFLIIIQNKQTF